MESFTLQVTNLFEKLKQVHNTPTVLLTFIISAHVHRCGVGGSMRAYHVAGPGSILGRDKFHGWGFFGIFPHL